MKTTLFFLFFILYITSVCAYGIMASPEEIVFNGYEGDTLCTNISVSTENIKEIVIEDKWAKEGFFERKLLYHNKTKEEVGIYLSYEKETIVIDKKNIEICLSGGTGNYHGILLIRAKGENAGIGVWINVNIIKKDIKTIITGNSIKNTENGSIILLIILLSVTLALLTKKLILKINITKT